MMVCPTNDAVTSVSALKRFKCLSAKLESATHILVLIITLYRISVQFFYAALLSRCGHYIFALWFLLLSSLLNPSSHRVDVYHTFYAWHGLSVNFECRSKTCCTRLAGNTGRKNYAKIAICAPSHNFVALNLRN